MTYLTWVIIISMVVGILGVLVTTELSSITLVLEKVVN